MSWNIQTPGDYINGPLTVTGSATITGNLTVDTNTLFVDSTNDNVGIGTTTPASYAFNDPVKLAIANTGTAGAGNTFTIASGSTGFGNFAFANGTSGTTRYNGYITYNHSSNFMAFHTNAGVERARLNSTGAFVLAGGTATANGIGITFPATQVASSDANTLDDYVETTFNPTIVGSSTTGSATYSTQVGRATKVGRLVTFQLRVAYSAGTGTGNLRVGGLPFTAGVGSVFTIYAENIALTASNYAVASLSSGNTFISVDQLPVGGGAATAVAYDAAGDIQISGSYIV
jgi:hypothetical protein